MKIDRSRVRKSTSEVPLECQQLIDRLQQCSRTELLDELSRIQSWTFGKCELLHWAQILDVFDRILGQAAERNEENKWVLKCDTYNEQEFQLLINILRFTSLLIEHSFSRHLYNSMEHLIVLLESNDMSVVLEVLNLLYMFSKRSNFITRLKLDEKECLLSRLQYLSENWGGKENGFGLADCCVMDKEIPPSATTLHVEFHREDDSKSPTSTGKPTLHIIHIEHIDKLHKTPAEIMKQLVTLYYVPRDKEMWLFTHVRLATHFADYKSRLKSVQARLQALSVMVYSNAIEDSPSNLLYNGLLEELVEVVELQDPQLTDIRCAALRTLTAIIHLDRNPHIPNRRPGTRLNNIIDVTGASQYHGFLPVLVRNCITSLTNQLDVQYTSKNKAIDAKNAGASKGNSGKEQANSEVEDHAHNLSQLDSKFPVSLTTALFSFLYHLASYESGGEALVSCGMMESLLQVINWQGFALDHITFVTRAVRVIDLITNIDMAAFQTHAGLHSFINRLDNEVNYCRPQQLYQIQNSVDNDESTPGPSRAPDKEGEPVSVDITYISENEGKTCLPQRAALLKSMLNFLKKAFQDSTFAESIRHLMEGTLPDSLKNIIGNAEYYGPSLFLLATDVVTVYVYQEPALLSALQDNGLTDVVLHSLLVKDVPATREVLGSLPNVFSALCLNMRGLESFAKFKPFEKLSNILLSPNYLPAMRRRRSSEPTADTACNLGNAMDELMRHQPSLRQDATLAIINLLNELVQLGTDPSNICCKGSNKVEAIASVTSRSNTANTEGSSDEEEEDEDETSTSSQNHSETQNQVNSERTPIALVDYILNTMKFIDAILSNNSTDDHCREFVNKGGIYPLLRVLGLPNLPVDYPTTVPAQAVASVCKSILNLAHEPYLFSQGLGQLSRVLESLKPLCAKQEVAGGSKLLLELANAPDLESAFSTASATPLLHAMGAAHGYVIMFVHICRTGQTEIRNLSLQHWGSEDGRKVLKGLADLYTSLVWESTLLLAYCSDDLLPSDCDFTKEEIEKLNAFFEKCEGSPPSEASVPLDILVATPIAMDIDPESSAFSKPQRNLRYIKPLLGASSRLGRALAELFGLLVKLCVGSPIRQRRGQNIVAAPPMPSLFARNVATELNLLLAEGLDCDKLPPCPSLKCRLTFLICSVGFTSPMLFDERRYPYHLMLKKFVSLGGQDIFFNAFTWAVTTGNATTVAEIQYSALPEGTVGFLDAWLTLLEKMVNPKAILESPHVISSRPGQNFHFDPLKYLQQVHKLAFESIMILWGKPVPAYCSRVTETTLTILRHIFRGEKIIKEKMKSEETRADPSTNAPTATAIRVRDLDDELRHLVDMGFSREHAIEALVHSHNLEQATDYLLSNPPQLARASGTGQMDVEAEDDQMLQAIAMSLGCSNSSSTDTKKDTKKDKKDLKKEEGPVRLSSFESMLNDFTQDAFDICLKLLDSLPETVHKVCDLLVTLMKRNGKSYRDMVLMALVVRIQTCVTHIYCCAFENKSVVMSYYVLTDSEQAAKLTNYVHLFILLFEVPSYYDMKIPCGNAINAGDLVEHIIELVCSTVRMLSLTQSMDEPKWLAPCLLLLDGVSKVATCTQRKYYMHRATTRIWRWYDIVTGKWALYSTINNQLINEAYWSGEQFVKISCGRKRYTITFCNMLQMNDETGNSRPISMIPMTLTHPTCTNIDGPDIPKPLHISLNDKEEQRCSRVSDLSQKQKAQIIVSCVRLLHLPIEKSLLHSVLQISVRYTRDFAVATLFVKEGGVKCLLKMRQINDFGGFGILATILIRHALEEPNTLKYAIEKVIRARTLATIPPPYKDLIYLSRQVGGAVTRAAQAFYQVANAILRIDTAAAKDEDPELTIPLRVEPPSRMKAPPLEEPVSIEVISDLLDALLKPLEDDKVMDTSDDSSEDSNPFVTFDEVLRKDEAESNVNTATEETSSKKNETCVTKKPMLPKSVILKILADAVVSFGPIAKLITEYKYKPDESGIITEETSALAFIFDKILTGADNISDLDCATMCRMLIAALASSNHSPEAQITLVSEVKVALTRALSLPESIKKHSQVQNICGIISNMIDNCPLPHASRWTSCSINNIVKLMMRRGVFNDLAKITHYLDLSSPNTPFTANAALKPLESLSRTINQPATATMSKSRKNQQTADENNIAQSGTSTEGANAHGEEIEDSENTEHDISGIIPSSLDRTAGSGEIENALEEMMEHILDHRSNDTNQEYNNVPTNRGNMEIDEDCAIGFEHERDATEELMSTDSGESDSNPSDQVDDEGNDDNEGDDDNIDDTEENEDNNYDEEDSNDRERRRGSALEGSSGMFRIATTDRDEDILMIQYDADLDTTLPRMIRWNETGSFAMPFIEENNTTEHSAITHPLLVSRTPEPHQQPTATIRSQRTNRPRRYQYLFNPRNPNPPVILQSIRRLLGPHEPHAAPTASVITANNILGGPPEIREAARVVVMDNFGIIPSNEEQIDFVDQSGFLFGPSLAATLSHIPPVLHWWNIESKLLDLESVYDCTTYACNRLIPDLIKYRNEELRNKKEKEEELSKKRKQAAADQEQDEYSGETVLFNYDEANTTSSGEQNKEEDGDGDPDADPYDPAMPVPHTDEDIDGIPIEISDSSSERIGSTLSEDIIIPPLHISFIRGSNENSESNSETTQNAAVQTIGMPNTLTRITETIDSSNTLHRITETIDTSSNTITRIMEDSNGGGATEIITQGNDRDNPFGVGLPLTCRVVLTRPDSPDRQDDDDDDDDSDSISEAVTNSLLNSIATQDPSLFAGYEETYVFEEAIGQQMEYIAENVVEDRVTDRSGSASNGRRDTDTRDRGNDTRDRGRDTRDNDRRNRERETRGRDGDRVTTDRASELRDARGVVESRDQSDHETRERVQREIREGGGRESRERIDREIRERADREIRERVDREIRERADREARERIQERIQRDSRERGPARDSREREEMARDRDMRLRSRESRETPNEESLERDREPRTSNEREMPSCSTTGANYMTLEPFIVPHPDDLPPSDAPVILAVAADPEPCLEPCLDDDDDEEEIPEGVDPSFLEALPPEMRREVLEQHRILCLQQRIAAASAANAAAAAAAAADVAATSNSGEQPQQEEAAASSEASAVSPEFLAALPPALQEEVLTQQRLEQQRQAAARANPNEPVDAGAFFETLQPSLRTMILSDMEDSQMSALPPDLAAEAQNLRRDWYARNRQMAQERFLQNSLGSIYRHARGRQTYRPNNFQRGWTQWSREFINNSLSSSSPMKIRGRQLLDPEGLACLLVLLFTDDSHLNKLRLHRVIRNLCYHAPTREWIINALLSIIEKSVTIQPDDNLNKPSRKGPRPGPLTSKLLTDAKHLQNGGNWLTIRMEAALGCAANVFIVNKTVGKKCDKSSGSAVISIHPQAAPIVCRNTLDLFTSLAKTFPSCLLPIKSIRDDNDKSTVTPIRVRPESFPEFWDVLLRLDSATKKGKSIQKNAMSTNLIDFDGPIHFEHTVFGKLLNMLASPVVNKNTQLTDNLLKLLSVTTSGMPELVKPSKTSKAKVQLTDTVNNPPTHALRLAVNVITYKNCSEEGLEFITNLLLNLANSSVDMSFIILNLLLNGAIEIGNIVETQIQLMLKDLKDMMNNSNKRKHEEAGTSASKGIVFNRFTNEQVVITASSKVKASCELQLPSMIPLTSKSSSQVFFLRVLRVIVQIRNSIKDNWKSGHFSAEMGTYELPALSEQLSSLSSFWETLSRCLSELEHAPDHHAVLVLQPAVEAFFLVHSPQQGPIKPQEKDTKETEMEENAEETTETQSNNPSTSDAAAQATVPPASEEQSPRPASEINLLDWDKYSETSGKASITPEQQQFLAFAEKHRTVLNQILRQSTAHLADGPFAVLVDHTRILDFDIKRRYFRTELERLDHGTRREETAVHVKRGNIFEDSFRELFRRTPEEWKNRFYIVFEDEEGQDAGGLLREWYVIISRDIFNPMYALFTVSPGDRVTYMINSSSHYNSNHLCYYKFVGRVIAKAIYDNKLLECYFTRSFYKHILGIPVKYTDMESEDYSFYRGLVFLMENHVKSIGLELTFSTEISEFGVTETRDLIPNGRHIPVTEETKMEYVRLVCQMKMTGAIKQQLHSFLEGFYDIIPKRLISIFNEQELELLISGLPNVDIDDLKANTEYHKYQTNSLQIQWFWRALRSFDQADRAKFLQFVTGTSKVPLQGFGALEGMNGVQKFQIHRDDRSTDRLPSAHTCFNQLDLPVYETYDKLRAYLLKAIHECSEGFGFA